MSHPEHGTATGSNHPPHSRSHPERSRRASAMAASVTGSANAATMSSRVHGSTRHAASTSASTPRGCGRGSNACPARRVSSPSATSTSSTLVTGAAPSRSRRFVPADARLRGDPGTAMTSTSRSNAAWAVISEPPRSRLSTTTRTSLRPAMMRLRIGNRNGSGAVPGGHSDNSTPRSPTAAHRPAWTRGYGRSSPLPTTPTGRPTGVAMTPRCAAPSMPFASPDTTVTPAAASSRPSPNAVSRPLCVALRVPTTPTRRPSTAARSPRANSTAGGCGSARSATGQRGSDGVIPTTPMLRQMLRPVVRRAPLGRGAPRGRDRRPHHRRDGRRRHGTSGGNGERFAGRVMGEEPVEAGDGHQVEPGERREHPGDDRARLGAHATSPGAVPRTLTRSDIATSMSATSIRTSAGSAPPGSRTARRSATVRATRRTRW